MLIDPHPEWEMRMRPRSILRRFTVPVLLGLAFGWLPIGAAAGAEPVTIEARPLVGGRYEAGGWLALQVSVANAGPPTQGYLTTEGETGAVQRFVELPGGARKTVPLYVRAAAFTRQIRVRLVATDGATLGEARTEVSALQAAGRQIGIVGDAANVRPQLEGGVDDFRGGDESFALAPGDLPERPEPLAGVDALVWATDASQLSEAQRRSIERWVSDGGQLVVLGGAEWQSRSEAFASLLPVENLRTVDGASAASLGRWAGSEAALPALTASIGDLRDGASTLVPFGADAGEAASTPLISSMPVGGGSVLFVAVDMATEVFRAWEGSASLWSRLMPSTRLADEFFGIPAEQDLSLAFVSALGSIPALQVPPAELLLLVIVGYIVLIGPVSYLVLKRLDRRELAWVTAPALVAVFSAGSYGMGGLMKGGDIVLNEIAIARTAAGGTAASVESYAGLFSPNRASYDLTVRGDALLAALGSGSAFDQQGRPITPRANVEQGDPAHLRDLEVSVYAMQSIRADALVRYEPSLEVAWHFEEGRIVGTARNIGPQRMEDVAAVANGVGELIGDLDPGVSRDFEMRGNAFGGNPPSTQIYGFDDFGSQRDATEAVRRQVIDGLVGYGFGAVPFGAPGAVGPLTSGQSPPMMIGWRTGEVPIDVEVDGRRVERHAQTVEVVSARPAYRPGPVEIGPGQVTARVTATEGDASADANGASATITVGSAEYHVALPLELAAVEPTRIEIVAGSDPHMLISGEQFGAGFFPPGYTLSVFDLSAGEWVALGDLSRDLEFELEDPARYLDDTGQMRVRVTGEGPALEQAPGGAFQSSVMVSATIEGVLP